jgi:hypothetical protein
MPHVENFADFLVPLPPIFPLTGLGTIQGGLACSAVLLCLDPADDAAPDHDFCLIAVRVQCSVK